MARPRRTELNEHLQDRIDLISQLSRQTLADSESSQADLRRIRSLQVPPAQKALAHPHALRVVRADMRRVTSLPRVPCARSLNTAALNRRRVRDAPKQTPCRAPMPAGVPWQAAADGEKAAFDAAMRALDDDFAGCDAAPDP
jgi:hypothetical protein